MHPILARAGTILYSFGRFVPIKLHMAHRDLRRDQRNACLDSLGIIEVSWVAPDSDPRFARGRCLDASANGLRLEFPVALPVRTTVTLRMTRIDVSGSASVRHVRRTGMKFVIGFEFSQHLRRQVAQNIMALQPVSPPASS
jgi:hypothetical protein